MSPGRRRRSLRRLVAVVVATAALAVGPGASAAGRDPHLGYVYPAGGQRGTSFRVTLGGQYLYDATRLLASGDGITATIVERERQLTPKEQNDAKETLSKLQEKRKAGLALTPEEVKAAEEIRAKLTAFGRRLANPSLGEFLTLDVALAADAAPGRRELRLETTGGLSNPLAFHVDVLPEVSKAPWKNVPERRGSLEPHVDARPPERHVTLPVVLNGQIPPGGADRYRFAAREGQPLVVLVRARELVPFIADAVPGWLQATVALFDAAGHEVAFTDDYRFHADPVLFCRIPAAGDYVLEVKDALFRGREDFVYRITAGELPFVTDVFPLGGTVGSRGTVAASGWNLPFDRLPLDLTAAAPGFQDLPVAGIANVVRVDADTLPERLEHEANDDAARAEAVTLPLVVNGRIDRPGDVDVFRFEGRAGESVVAEVVARRLDSPVDSVLVLTDAEGRTIAANDDHEDKGSGLETHHADSWLSVALPATGTYRLRIADAQHGGGPSYGYRLRIGAPRPDFALRATPSSLCVRGGASIPLTVFALREDGFAGEIELVLLDAPLGFTLTGARIAAGEDRALATLTAPASAAGESFRLRVVGRAKLGGRFVAREAVPADDMTQAFAYRHLVPAERQEVRVLAGTRASGEARVLSATPIRIPVGGTARVEVFVPLGAFMKNLEFELYAPPEGVSLKATAALERGTALVLEADATKAKAGTRGHLIVNLSAERGGAGENAGAKAGARRLSLGSLPAIPFELTPP